MVVTSGNHDSAQRLGFGSRLIDAAGVFIRTDAAASARPVLLEDEHGPVAVYGLPYLDPDAVREPWGLPARSHEAALAEAMRRVRADLRPRRPAPARSCWRTRSWPGAQPQRLRARHQRRRGLAGADVASSTASTTPPSATSTARHVLTDRVRYSGSPLAYSFSEADHVKGSWLVELGAEGFAQRRASSRRPVPRPLARLRGDLDDLLADPALAARRGRPGCRPRSPTTSARSSAMERLRAPLPPRPGARLRADATRAAGQAPRPGRTDAATTTIALDFVADAARRAGHARREPTLLQRGLRRLPPTTPTPTCRARRGR